ncbi:enhancer of rudimentary [Chytriomyces sp. MP71]|nr:enhancer of rudimentary [Chytriomyces sp. MP71]
MTPKRRLGHCVLFLQTSADTSTRTWNDFETAAQAIEWLLARFEHKLKAVAATTPAIQYEMPAIFKFVDSLSDVAMFVSIEGSSIALSEDGAPIYAPKGREWIKTQIVHLLDGDPVRL